MSRCISQSAGHVGVLEGNSTNQVWFVCTAQFWLFHSKSPPQKNSKIPRSRCHYFPKSAASFWMISDDNKPLLWNMMVCKPTRVKERMGDFGGSTDHVQSLDFLKKISPMTSRESSPLIFWGSWQYPILKHEKTISNWRCFFGFIMTDDIQIWDNLGPSKDKQLVL